MDKYTREQLYEMVKDAGIKGNFTKVRKSDLIELLKDTQVKQVTKKESTTLNYVNYTINIPIGKVKRIFHISDLHIRNEEREDYSEILTNLIRTFRSSCKQAEDIIIITGDLIHNPRDLRPRMIKMLTQTIKNLAAIVPVIIIAGNHDLTGTNEMDAIEGILGKIPGVHYLMKSGVYMADNVEFHVFARNDYGLNSKITGGEKPFKIALYHGPTFTHDGNFDFVLLGDIHKPSIWKSGKTTLSYAGSLIAQDSSETHDHGYNIWNVTTGSVEFIPVHSNYLHLNLITGKEPVPDTIEGKRIFLKTFELHPINTQELLTEFSNKGAKIVSWIRKTTNVSLTTITERAAKIGLSQETIEKYGVQPDAKFILSLDRFTIKRAYGIRELEHSVLPGLTLVTSSNRSGKSSLIRALEFAFFYEYNGSKSVHNINEEEGYDIWVEGIVNSNKYHIQRKATSKTQTHFAYSTNLPVIPKEHKELMKIMMICSSDYPGLESRHPTEQMTILYTLFGVKKIIELKDKVSRLKTEIEDDEVRLADIRERLELYRELDKCKSSFVTLLTEPPVFDEPEPVEYTQDTSKTLNIPIPDLFWAANVVDLDNHDITKYIRDYEEKKNEPIEVSGPALFNLILVNSWIKSLSQRQVDLYQLRVKDYERRKAESVAKHEEYQRITESNRELDRQIEYYQSQINGRPRLTYQELTMLNLSGGKESKKEELLQFLNEEEKLRKTGIDGVEGFVRTCNSFLDQVGAGITIHVTDRLCYKRNTIDFEYLSFSKSEKVIIGLAIRYALKARANVAIDILFIDEQLDTLDYGSATKAVTMIELLQTVYKSIVLITHKQMIGCKQYIKV